jgi:hypothetical protein
VSQWSLQQALLQDPTGDVLLFISDESHICCGFLHSVSVCCQVWPYMKPLRRWIKKRQYNNPTWDMPVSNSTPEQAQQPHPQQVQQQGSDSAGINVQMPYYPQQVQELLGSDQTQQQAASSPQHRQQQQQPGQQQGARTPGSNALQQLLSSASKGASSSNSSSRVANGSNPGSYCGPLAALFGAAAAASGAAAGGVAAAAGAAVSCPRQFRFDAGLIMHALQPAATAAQR